MNIKKYHNFFTQLHLFVTLFIGIELFYLLSALTSLFVEQMNYYLFTISIHFFIICAILYAHQLIKDKNNVGFHILYFLIFANILWIMWQITDITAFSILNYSNISWLLFIKLISINYFSIIFFIFSLFLIIKLSIYQNKNIKS